MKKLPIAFRHLAAQTPWRALAALGFVTVLYVCGLTVVYVPVVIWLLARYVPLPSIFRSWLARIVVSILLFYALFQLVVVMQFFVFPDSGFKTLSILTAMAIAALLAVVRRRAPKPVQGPFVNRSDAVAGIAVACFVVPLVLLAGLLRGSPVAITQLASIQSYDAVNHFMGELEMGTAQHLTYRTVDYYPKGFHITTMFIQNGVGLNVANMGWGAVTRVFIGQYLVFGALLAYVLVYMCLALYRAITPKLASWLTETTLGLTVGVAGALLYLLPFTHQGFINYYYGIATAVCGLLYLLDMFQRPEGMFRPHWYVFGYFLLLFGLSMSWPLLIPPFLAIGILCMFPEKFSMRHLVTGNWSWGALAALSALLLQFIPIYFQLKYWALSTSGGLNTPGSITAFHFALLSVGLALVVYTALQSAFSRQLRRFVVVVYLPLYAFVGALVAFQYFTAGEIRYFAIKVAYSLEILLIVLAAALVVRWYASSSLPRLHIVATPVITVVLTAVLLNGITANPLLDLREMFRTWSQFGTPVFYDSDTARTAGLGVTGKLSNGNVVVLHFDALTQTLYGNLAVSKWANTMQIDKHIDEPARHCADKLFPIVMFEAVGPDQQNTLRAELQKCVTLTNDAGRTFYVVTDDASEPYLRNALTGNVTFVR
jgi:hypothetical protein